MLTMSTLMMPAPAMTAAPMSTPGLLPVPSKLEVAGKITINHSAPTNKAGMSSQVYLTACIQHVAISNMRLNKETIPIFPYP